MTGDAIGRADLLRRLFSREGSAQIGSFSFLLDFANKPSRYFRWWSF
jgi:hypothetical protein